MPPSQLALTLIFGPLDLFADDVVDAVGGEETLLLYRPDGSGAPHCPGLRRLVIGEDLIDAEGLLARRLDASPGAAYLIRPDQHLAARWRTAEAPAIAAASRRLRGAFL